MFKALFFIMLIAFLALTIVMGVQEEVHLQILFATVSICAMIAMVGEHIIEELKK